MRGGGGELDGSRHERRVGLVWGSLPVGGEGLLERRKIIAALSRYVDGRTGGKY